MQSLLLLSFCLSFSPPPPEHLDDDDFIWHLKYWTSNPVTVEQTNQIVSTCCVAKLIIVVPVPQRAIFDLFIF